MTLRSKKVLQSFIKIVKWTAGSAFIVAEHVLVIVSMEQVYMLSISRVSGIEELLNDAQELDTLTTER